MIAPSTELPTVVFTDHAIERVGERFGFTDEIKIPTGILQVLGSSAAQGKKFRFRHGRVIYICQRQKDKVVVLTVMSKTKKKKVKPCHR